MNQNVSGESFFSPLPEKFLHVEKDFVPFDQSVVWDLNEVFWQNTKLWEKTYGEHYEKSLPSGLSSSHYPEFIKKSVKHLLKLFVRLEKEKKLPGKVYVLEQAPGSGKYTEGFLDLIQKRNPDLYEKIIIILSDTSKEILETCEKNLKSHEKKVIFYQQKSTYDLPHLNQKIIFARHGNFWDQLPCKIYQKKEKGICEIYTKAVIDKNLQKELGKIISLDELTILVTEKKLTTFLKDNPQLWKPLVRSLKLLTQITSEKLNTNLYHQLPEDAFIVNSYGVLKNLSKYINLIDWQNHGYLEVIDIVLPNQQSFLKNRLPQKYDGALATAVNGLEVKELLRKNNLFFSYTPIKGINSVTRIFKHSLIDLLQHQHFLTIAEIAAAREQTTEELQQKTDRLFSAGADIIAFSDQAGASENFFAIEELTSSPLFSQLNGSAVMTNIAVRRKNKKTLEDLFLNLQKNNVKNIFILAGDPGPNDAIDKLSWRDVLPLAAKDFFVGAVAHPQVTDIKNSLEKEKLGAKFLIVQASYDQKSWQQWLSKIKEEKLYEKIPLIPVIIPITSKRLLSVIESLPDIPVSGEIKNYFLNLSDEQIKEEGIKMAKELLTEYKNEGIFSGVYLYSKSEEVVKEILQ